MRKLEVGQSERFGKWVMLPIELTTIEPTTFRQFGYVRATKRPYAWVVAGDGARRALDADGTEISLAELMAEVPGIESALNSFADF